MSNTFLAAPPAWQNHYLVMRHGHSEANQQGLIISSPERGLPGYGLSPFGVAQLDEVIARWEWRKPTCILHSDFRRTTETARKVAARFMLPVQAEPRLRERNFGLLDGQADSRYDDVWALDAEDPAHNNYGVESVVDVAVRMREVLAELERTYYGETILLVSHGDPLQILLTALEGSALSRHREHESLVPAGVIVVQ